MPRVGAGDTAHRWVSARRLALQRRGLTRAVAPHLLRHTCVVWSLAEGVPIQVVSEMIGHTSPQMTYDVHGGLVNLHDPVMAHALLVAVKRSSRVSSRPPCELPGPGGMASRDVARADSRALPEWSQPASGRAFLARLQVGPGRSSMPTPSSTRRPWQPFTAGDSRKAARTPGAMGGVGV